MHKQMKKTNIFKTWNDLFSKSFGMGEVYFNFPVKTCKMLTSLRLTLFTWIHRASERSGAQDFVTISPQPLPCDHIIPTWPQTSRCPLHTKSDAKGSNCVKWSRYTTLKINNKHQTNVSAHFVFFPVCEYSVLVYPTGFDFFYSKIKALKKNIPSQKYLHLNVRF